MRIDNNLSIRLVNPIRNKTVQETKETSEATDAASISSRAEDLRVAFEALRETPAVREEQVEELKAQIAEGTVTVDEDALVQKLMDRATDLPR